MPDAERRCTDASLLWSAEVDRSVLRLLALPASGRLGTPFDLATCDAKAFVVNGSECQHVLLRGRAGSIRLDVFSGSLLYGPVRSDEHTSEPQSLMRISYAVFCLNKKKTSNQMNSLLKN